MRIGDHEIRNFANPYLIAEIGANHNGDVAIARQLIDAAKEAGWQAAKFQSWSAESIFSRTVYEQNYFLSDDYRNRRDFTLREIVDEYSTTFDELRQLARYCREIGIDFCCTPFSRAEVDFLIDELDVPFVKIASMDCNNYPFLDYVARRGKPIVLSTGLASLHEIDRAVETIERAGNSALVLLHCVSQYPPKLENVNLNNMDLLRSIYPDYAVGFSDHTIGTAIPLAAIAKGAAIIEKHITLDKTMSGWDHKVSATPEEMMVVARDGRQIVTALGAPRRRVTPEDMQTRAAYRRSVVSAREIPEGKRIERADLDAKRPGTGLPPEFIDLIVGRTAKRAIAADEILTHDDF
jgi:N-acetylneuraminate synthase